METGTYILAIDQGTSGTKAIIFDQKGRAIAEATEPLKTQYLEGGWVEQDPEGIYQNVLVAVAACLKKFKSMGMDPREIVSCGISNQRETFLLWDRSGKPLYNAVVWQCKRSVDICVELQQQGLQGKIQEKTGLLIDPYFSGTKLMWLYRERASIRETIQQEAAYFGTVDTWLLYRLTKGEQYLTDYTNASRTLFFNLDRLEWDRELLELFELGTLRLPEAKPSAYAFGASAFEGLFEEALPITAMIGDSHAAAFGEACIEPGTAKATLGTGCSILCNVGTKRKDSSSGMVSTICWSTEERVDYALEGVIVSCASPIAWLKSALGLFEEVSDTEAMAYAVADNNGVYLIPAFSGLGAPHWDMKRKASIEGLTFDCNKNHVVRAALESIGYQIKDVLEAIKQDAGVEIQGLMVNGGATANSFVMQFLSDLLEGAVYKSSHIHVSALGAGFLAGLKAGVFADIEGIRMLYEKQLVEKKSSAESYYEQWKAHILRGETASVLPG